MIADAILFACETPRRVMYIGSGGLISSLIGQLAPRVTDFVMEAVGERIQQRPGDPGDPARRDNLYEYRTDGAEKTSQDVWMRKRSYAVSAQKRPGRVLSAGLIGLGELVTARRAFRRGK